MCEMTSDIPLPKQETIKHTDGDVHFHFTSVDGVGLPPFQGFLSDGAAGRMKKIYELETREDDIILATYPKSGTHWMWEIINMLIQGKAEYRRENKNVLMLEAMFDLEEIKSERSPRILNTHVPYRWLPGKHVINKGKIVHGLRNPKDVSVSLFNHMRTSGEIGEGTKDMTWEQFFENIVIGDVTLYDGWFSYEKQMHEAMMADGDHVIYTLHYEKLKENPEGEIKRLAEFLQVTCSDQLASDITDACSFRKLKNIQKYLPNDFLDKINTLQEKSGRSPMTPPVIYRKGTVGDWKNYFTVSQNERFDARYNEEMKEFNLDLLYDCLS